MHKILTTALLLLLCTSLAFSQSPEDVFATFNYYPKYTIGLSKTEMLARYPELKELKKQGMLTTKKFSYYSPSFTVKNEKVCGYSGIVYVSDQLSPTDNPTKTKLLSEKYVKEFTDKFHFEPKVDETSNNSSDFVGTSTTYTWEKNTRRFVLTESSSYDKAKLYYGMIHISVVDEALAK